MNNFCKRNALLFHLQDVELAVYVSRIVLEFGLSCAPSYPQLGTFARPKLTKVNNESFLLEKPFSLSV